MSGVREVTIPIGSLVASGAITFVTTLPQTEEADVYLFDVSGLSYVEPFAMLRRRRPGSCSRRALSPMSAVKLGVT